MNLNLKKPLAIFDLETTGVNTATDRIVEISILRVDASHSETSRTQRVNPTIPIPAESTAIHGISNEDVKDAPTFKMIAHEIADFLTGCDLAGFNSNRFDLPLLVEEFLRADVPFKFDNRNLVDAQKIFHKMEERTLSAALKFYCGRDLIDAHTAEADVRATYDVLKAQVERYEQLPNDMEGLHDFSSDGKVVDVARRFGYDSKNRIVFNFGKHRGKAVNDVLRAEPAYYDWMMRSDFPLHTKQKLTEIKLAMNSGELGF